MTLWRTSRKDAALVAISVGHLLALGAMAATWQTAPWPAKILIGFAVIGLTTYNIIVVSHLFTHVPWFADSRLNAVMSVVNSINIGQSVQAYQFSHVRNHHRYTNDRRGSDGTTRDRSSTFRNGKDGEHEHVLSYAVIGAIGSLGDLGKQILGAMRLWKVGANEAELLSMASRQEPRRVRELRQIRIDRAAHCMALLLFALISWTWVAYCYVPAFFLALALVNIQNYYRHFGADPDRRTANSVSYYGKFYNLVTFNDGYHQEHHLAPAAHWSSMPAVRERYRDSLDGPPRIVSPVPAMLGFLHRGRPLLHRMAD